MPSTHRETFSIRLDPKLMRLVKTQAVAKNVRISELIETALKNTFKEEQL